VRSRNGNRIQSISESPSTNPNSPHMNSPTGTSAADQASHIVCNRSIPVARRSRRRTATTPTTRLARIPSQSTNQTDPTLDSLSQVPTALFASGFATAAASPSNGVGSSIASAMNATKHAAPAAATQRQRGESSRPSGKT
jgi:hypothetical protein